MNINLLHITHFKHYFQAFLFPQLALAQINPHHNLTHVKESNLKTKFPIKLQTKLIDVNQSISADFHSRYMSPVFTSSSEQWRFKGSVGWVMRVDRNTYTVQSNRVKDCIILRCFSNHLSLISYPVCKLFFCYWQENNFSVMEIILFNCTKN